VTGSHAVRVLVAGDDYYASLAVVRGLRARGYEPWFATYSPLTFAGRSRATAGTFKVPRPVDGDDAYVAALADAAARCGASVVLPCNELAIKAVAGREGMFGHGIVVASNTRETVERATDKALLAELGAAAGVPAPPTIELDLDELDAHRSELRFPAVVKPAQTAVRESGRTLLAPPAEVVHDIASLERALAEPTRRLVQPFLDATLTAVSGVSWKGEVACSVHQAARRIYPRPLGVSAFAETVPVDEAVDTAVRAILRDLGWSGIFEVQLLRTATGAHVIDLNPRPYGSLALAIGAGANLPAVWVDLLLGREPLVEPYRVGVRYRAEIREARALLGAIVRGRVGDALRIARPMRRTVHSIFSVRDPKPLLSVLARGTARFPRAVKG
jgi:predicted ATP-grasp superfamily ATP-dependent carboligase